MAIDTLYSIVNYTGDGTTKSFTVPFPYLYVNDVHLSVDDEEVDVYPVISHDNPPAGYGAHWYSSNTIRFVTAPASDAKITIQRTTNRAEPEVEFENSAILTEEDLNLIATQLIYIVQEAYDHFEISYEDVTTAIEEIRDDTIAAKDDAIEAKEDAIAAKEDAEDAKDAAQGYAEDASEYADAAQATLDQVKLETIGKIDNTMSQGMFQVEASSEDWVEVTLPNNDYYVVSGRNLMLFKDDDDPRLILPESASGLYGWREVGQVGERSNKIEVIPDAQESTHFKYQIIGLNAASLVDDNTIKWDAENGISVDAEAVLGDVEDVIRENVEEDVAELLDDEYQKINVKEWQNTLDYDQGAMVTGTDGNLYVALASNGASTTAVNPVNDTTLTWKNLSTVNYIDVADFGAKGDGTTDDTDAINAAATAAYSNKALLYFSSSNYLIADDINIKTEVLVTRQTIIKTADWETDQDATVTIFFGHQCDIHDFVFCGVNVKICTSDGSQIMHCPTTITRNVFRNSYLTIGQDTMITNRYVVQGNTFNIQISRRSPTIKLINANNVVISENNINSCTTGVLVEPTRSFGANGIEIRNNNIQNFSYQGIYLCGSSMNRISNVTIENNIICSGKGISRTYRIYACICMIYAHQVNIRSNTMNSYSNVLSFVAVSHLDVSFNTLQQDDTYHTVQFDRSRYVSFTKNLFKRFDNGYHIMANGKTSASVSTQSGCIWKGHDIWIEDNTFECGASKSCIRYGEFKNIHIKRNVFISKHTSGFYNGAIIHSPQNASDTGSIIDNVFYAASGTPIKDTPSGVITTLSDQTIQTTSAPSAPTIATPIITNSDSDLNNEKSYVVTFTLGDPTQLKAMLDNDNLKTMTQWMTGVTGATLAWNSCAWQTTTPNSVVNGNVIYAYGGDHYYTHMTGAIFIDNDGYITCRDYAGSNADTCRGSIQIAEDAWQTAFFRTPLVVDGAVYDVDRTGIYPKTDFQNALSARTCLGQKADGTYVLLVVDGKSGVYGCTMEQAANKLLSLGCIHAFNLDGGGSTTLWYNGSVINSPSDAGGERAIPAVMYI